jgi:hypothetical protein
MKFPILFEHFSEHKNLTGNISFWEFIVMHYTTNVSHDSDDNKLPFKDPAHTFTAPVLALPTLKFSIEENYFVTNVIHGSLYQEAFFASPLSEIFQPPKV